MSQRPLTTHRTDAASVLVVEDDDDIREIVVSTLADDGFEVRSAADGRAALRALETDRAPDVAVVDLRLPGGVGGDEVCRRLRARGRKVLLFSSSDRLAAAARASRANDWLAKPFDIRGTAAPRAASCSCPLIPPRGRADRPRGRAPNHDTARAVLGDGWV